MRIEADLFAKLPPHLKELFEVAPNPGKAEVLEHFPQTTSGKAAAGGHVRNSDKTRNSYGKFEGQRCEGAVLYGDSGSAARFSVTGKSLLASSRCSIQAT